MKKKIGSYESLGINLKLTSIKSGNLYCGDIVYLLLMLYRINIYLKSLR